MMGIDMSLYLPAMLYGNVGVCDWLDFMVMRTVFIETSQIECLCDSVERRLLVLNSFAEAARQFSGFLMPMGQ